MNDRTNNAASFVIKVIMLSLFLSILLKYGGPLLPLQTPYTTALNGLAIAIVVLPSTALGLGLILLAKASHR
ncbi:MAG: hypothetical protein HC800_10085 [Phormidesmis sp. RL_2_1]|nr:hypothetical protein [Phormidesmis sp. RL_2_1]